VEEISRGSIPASSIAVLSGLGQFNETTIPKRMIERLVANKTASDCLVKFHCKVVVILQLNKEFLLRA